MRTQVVNQNGRNGNRHEYLGLTRSITRSLDSAAFHHTPHGFTTIQIMIEERMQIQRKPGILSEQRMKIIRVQQSAGPTQHDAFPLQHLKKKRARTLPTRRGVRKALSESSTKPPEMLARLDGKNVYLTPVSNLVQDHNGNFYEIRGGQSRRLGDLVMDEQARVFELGDSTHPQASRRLDKRTSQYSPQPNRMKTSSVQNSNNSRETSRQDARTNRKGTQHPNANDVAPEKEISRGSASELTNRSQDGLKTELCSPKPVKSGSNSGQANQRKGYRKIFAEPGIRLDVNFGQFEREIASQLEHPAKLDPKDQIEIYVQVYETRWQMPVSHIARIEMGNPRFHCLFRLFTRERAHRLGLPQLFKPTRYPFDTQDSEGKIYAGQRLYRLWPVFDPTAIDQLDR